MKAPFLVFLSIFVISCSLSHKQPKGNDTLKMNSVSADADKYSFLLKSKSDETKKWITKQNRKAKSKLINDSRYKNIEIEVAKIKYSKDKLVYAINMGKYSYNLYKSKKRPKGVWRRTLVKHYHSGRPQWQEILDIDKLALSEKKDWKFVDYGCLAPNFNRCILLLSDGGNDKTVIREYSLEKMAFVTDGFNHLTPAKNSLKWLTKDLLYIASDFGKGSLSKSSYPRKVKLWERGKPVKSAELILSADAESTGLWPLDTKIENGLLLAEYTSFRLKKYYIHQYTQGVEYLSIPTDAIVKGSIGENLIIELKTNWKVEGSLYTGGSIISLNYITYLKQKTLELSFIFKPGNGEFIDSIAITNQFIVVSLLKDVISEIVKIKRKGKQWITSRVDMPKKGAIYISSYSEDRDDLYLVYSSFTKPSSIYYVDLKKNSIDKIQSLPEQFRSKDMVEKQLWTISKDGTNVPFFVVHKKGLVLDGQLPTLLYGYGAGGSSMKPFYLGEMGKVWLEKGGVYVLGILRGGNEFGYKWRTDGYRSKKQNTFDDFIAISEALIKRGYTNPSKLGIFGKSWGGLLVSAVMLQRPELYKAVYGIVPMLDMLNFHKMGANMWKGEFGDPEVIEDYKVLRSYSPYHNINPQTKLPNVYYYNVANDDRMHPGHSRRMTAKLQDAGSSVLYFESENGGHNGYIDDKGYIKMRSMRYMFFTQQLFD